MIFTIHKTWPWLSAGRQLNITIVVLVFDCSIFTLMDRIHFRFQVRGRSRMKFQAGRFSFWATRLVHEKKIQCHQTWNRTLWFWMSINLETLRAEGIVLLKFRTRCIQYMYIFWCVYKTAELASSLKTSTGRAGTIKKYVFNRKSLTLCSGWTYMTI